MGGPGRFRTIRHPAGWPLTREPGLRYERGDCCATTCIGCDNLSRQDRLLGCKRSSSISSISTHSTSARFCLVISSRVSVALRQNAAGWAISQSALRDIPFAPAVDGNCFWMRFAPRLPRRGPPSRSAPLDVPPALMASWTLFRAWDSFKQQKHGNFFSIHVRGHAK